MTVCIVVLSELGEANHLNEKLKNTGIRLMRCDLIQPQRPKESLSAKKNKETALDIDEEKNPNLLTPVGIETIHLLNPNLSKKLRQKRMAMLLMPFGFITGLTFTLMTGLTTFSDFGFGALGEPLTGGLVGMASGWMGSYAASGSVSSKNDEDINTLRKLSEEGKWLLLIETPLEIELPWSLLKEAKPMEIVRLLDQ